MNSCKFNEKEYLISNPDVAIAVKNGNFSSGKEHYEIYGRHEGRSLSMALTNLDRKSKVMHGLKAEGLGLEVGPSHSPIAAKRDGYNVDILDRLDQNQLRRKFAAHINNRINVNNIEFVDHVWQGQSLTELIGKIDYYDWIIASHVIEHIPNIINFLQECERLLKKDGRLSLVIPDKRYCFDALKPCSVTGEILDSFQLNRKRPSAGQIFEHYANSCKINGNSTWSADLEGDLKLINKFQKAYKLYRKSIVTDDYIDVHCWRFTPDSFRLLMVDLRMLRLINFEITHEFPTVGCEFYVTLGKSENEISTIDIESDRLNLLKNINGGFKKEVKHPLD